MLSYRITRGFKVSKWLKSFYYLFLLFSIIISFLIPVWLQSDLNGINNTLGRIYFPNGFIYKNFNSTVPWVQYPFFVQNGHKLTISELEVKVIIFSEYMEVNCSRITRNKIFQREDKFNMIEPNGHINSEINATYEWFDLEALNLFWMHVNLSASYSFLIDLEINGRFIWSLSSFKVFSYGINISLYESPFEYY